MTAKMKRRAFITLVGGAAVAWPLAARAQQTKVYRVGVLLVGNADADSFRTEPVSYTHLTLPTICSV